METEKRIAALEVQVQELQNKLKYHKLDKKIVLDAITIEVDRLQKINEHTQNHDAIRENAKCIADLANTFATVSAVYV